MERLYVDAIKFEDLRPISGDFNRKCRLRVSKYLKPNGKYILDVASGPVQFPEYLSYSKDYDFRICADISLSALKEAKIKLGGKGIYILANITELSIRNNSVDAAISLHTIYHVPRNEQKTSFEEVYRVLKPGSTAVVVYSWGNRSCLMKVMIPYRVIRKIGKIIMSKGRETNATDRAQMLNLYFYAHPYKWFKKQQWSFDFDVVVWRSVNIDFQKLFIHERLIGKSILAALYWLEETFPHIMGRLGQYPMFIIRSNF